MGGDEWSFLDDELEKALAGGRRKGRGRGGGGAASGGGGGGGRRGSGGRGGYDNLSGASASTGCLSLNP